MNLKQAGKKIIKIRAEINENENKKKVEKINKTKNWFFKNINKIDKTLAGLTKKSERERERENASYQYYL